MTVDAALSEQDALDIASIMDTAKHDKDTKIMLQKIKLINPRHLQAPPNLRLLKF